MSLQETVGTPKGCVVRTEPHLSFRPAGECGLCPLRDDVTPGRVNQLVLQPSRAEDIHREYARVRAVRLLGFVIVRTTRLDVHGLSIEARDATGRARGSREVVARVKCNREIVYSAVT
jgi:hypothetical protein